MSPRPLSAYKYVTPTRTRKQPRKSGYGFLRFILESIEGLPEIQRFLDSVLHRRRNGRPGYAPAAMLRLLCLKHLLNERFNVQLLIRLRESPNLRKVCGFRVVPSETTVCRFFRTLSEHFDLIEGAVVSMVNRLREIYPDIGEIVSIDATDIESYAHSGRNPPVDSDAQKGWRTPKGKVAVSNKQRFFGYKAYVIADSMHHIPLTFILIPGKANENPILRDVFAKAQKQYEWFAPKFAIADRGYDSQDNHKYLIERGIVPIIKMRRPTGGGGDLHNGIYTVKGEPTCWGNLPMTFLKTDPDTGKHLYACPVGGCDRYRSGKRNIAIRCKESQWEDWRDNPRVIGVIPRQSEVWDTLYALRQGLERAFGSLKRSRLLNRHQYVTMTKIKAHVGMSILTYIATMLGRVAARDAERMRQMRIRV